MDDAPPFFLVTTHITHGAELLRIPNPAQHCKGGNLATHRLMNCSEKTDYSDRNYSPFLFGAAQAADPLARAGMKAMLTRQLAALAVVTTLLGSSIAAGDEVRYYEKDGVTYRETRQVVQRRIPEVTYAEQAQTVYRDQCVTETKDTVRTSWTPVTEYRMQQRLVGRWNPFIQPYFVYENVPTVRWEARSEVVPVQTASRQLVPETRIVRTPVTSWRTVEEEVISRVAVSTSPSTSSALAALPSRSTNVVEAGPLVPVRIPESARGESIGGLSRLDSDPPRQGTSTAWRTSDDRLR